MRPIAGAESSALLLSIFESSNPEEYRFSSSALQRHLITTRDDTEEAFDCVHPNWFGSSTDAAPLVDWTICRFCGFRSHCSKGMPVKLVEAVTIYGYPGDNIPPEEIFQQCFLAPGPEGKQIKIDPFMAFSLEANVSRDLFAISQLSFNELFTESIQYQYLQDAVGYDKKYGQALWPVDQLFLETYLKNSTKIRQALSRIESYNNEKHDLIIHDQRSLNSIARKLGWLQQTDPQSLRDALHLIFGRLSSILNRFPEIKMIANRAMKPTIDHPFEMSGSGILHLAIRWAQLVPEDIQRYGWECDSSHKLYEEQQTIVERISPTLQIDALKIDRPKQYLPRFPMIAIVPEEEIPSLKLEHSAGRIIDVIIADVSQSFFLIDGLGIDLRQVWTDD